MSGRSEKLISWLFETRAVRVCPEGRPFWYTSGTIGPYYINTHFLYGSEEKANELLGLIDSEKHDKPVCIQKVMKAVKGNYRKDIIYKGMIDEMCLFVKSHVNLDKVDYISGGERRDWFFSILVADLLKKPHLSIFKDLTCVMSSGDETGPADRLTGKKVLHIADLITEASSYERAWIPAMESRGAEMKWSFVVVDRKQGGGELLAEKGVESHAMVSIDRSLFEKAVALGLMSMEQFRMIDDYIRNPKESMRNFLYEHPDFLRDALYSKDKTRERAELLLCKNPYDLDEEFLNKFKQNKCS